MNKQSLSPREDEIVSLAMEGLTNEGIAHALGLSIGTVNTYWQRIRLKIGGVGKTDTVAKLATIRAEEAILGSSIEPETLAQFSDEGAELALKAALVMNRLLKDNSTSTVWTVDNALKIRTIAAVDMPATLNGVVWEVGRTIYEIFGSDDGSHPAVAAHLSAIEGERVTVETEESFGMVRVATAPLYLDRDDTVGCIGLISPVLAA